MNQRERYRGAMLGLAAGDALGTTLEFQQPGSFIPIDDIVGGGPFHLPAGAWTDDTSMALCLAESLVLRQSFDPLDQMQRYVQWMDDGYFSSIGHCFDIGATTAAALEQFKATGDPYAGSLDPQTAGNGSLMRLAPVPLAFSYHPREAIERAGDSSRTTHAARTAIDACHFLSALLVGAVNGTGKNELLSPYYSPTPRYWNENPLHPEIDEIAAGIYKHKQPPEIEGTGYVVKTLEAALWAFYNSDNFRDGCLLAVNLGQDADTVGAVYGQLAGAVYGVASIPAEWRAKLTMRQKIEQLADWLYAMNLSLSAQADL